MNWIKVAEIIRKEHKENGINTERKKKEKKTKRKGKIKEDGNSAEAYKKKTLCRVTEREEVRWPGEVRYKKRKMIANKQEKGRENLQNFHACLALH